MNENVGSTVPKLLFRSEKEYVPTDCDCACGEMYEMAEVPPVKVEGKRWQAVRPAYGLVLRRGGEPWRVHYSPTAAAPIVVLNDVAHRLWERLREPLAPHEVRMAGLSAEITRQGLRRLAQAGIVRPVGEAVGAIVERQTTTLTVWLHLTEACNLRCPYCYVAKGKRQMGEATARAAVRRMAAVAARRGYKRLRLKFGGGEPTLNFETLRAAYEEGKVAEAEHGIRVEGVVLTNGVAWDEAKLNYIARAGLRMSLSLDGGEQAHNRLRVFPHGRGSFAEVMRTLERAMARRIPVTLSITVTQWNLDGLGEAVRIAMERGLPFNLNFVRSATVAPWVPEAKALMTGLREAFAVMEAYVSEYPHTLGHVLDRGRFDLPHVRPCAAGRDYVAVDVDGGVAACQMEVGARWSRIEAMDPLEEVRKRGREVYGTTVDELAECASCPWRYVCAGGCPLLRGTEVHRRYCRAYRTFYPEVVRLEALRLVAQEARYLAIPLTT